MLADIALVPLLDDAECDRRRDAALSLERCASRREDQAADDSRMIERDELRHAAAHRMAPDDRGTEACPLNERGGVGREAPGRVIVCVGNRLAGSALIERDDGMVAGKLR